VSPDQLEPEPNWVLFIALFTIAAAIIAQLYG
jgi:hypothetical protein